MHDVHIMYVNNDWQVHVSNLDICPFLWLPLSDKYKMSKILGTFFWKQKKNTYAKF